MTTSSYLEHYLDTLESLPGKLRRNFTLMLEMDEKNMNILKEVDSASDGYLRKVRDLSPDSRKVEMDKIQRMFKKAKEYGDEKVSIAIQTYEMVDKDIRRLDADLAKFEAEMREKGRTSQTETEEEDEPDEEENPAAAKKRGRKKANNNSTNNNSSSNGNNHGKADQASAAKKKKKAVKASSSTTAAGNGGSSASAAAATAASAAAAADDEGGPAGKGTGGKKKGKKGSSGNKGSEAPSAAEVSVALGIQPAEIIDMPVDPNEPTYCICQQVSYGEMIGCDNPECPIEWFHFGCIALTTKPKGKWYCPKCLPLFKKHKK